MSFFKTCNKLQINILELFGLNLNYDFIYNLLIINIENYAKRCYLDVLSLFI